MSGSKRKIRKILFEHFYDEVAQEYTGTPFSSSFLLSLVKQQEPSAIWKDIYYVIRQWQKRCNEYYDGIYNETKILLEAGVTDTRKACENKYNNFLTLFANEKAVPLFFDKDIGEYRVAKSLQVYEEIIGDKVLHYHSHRNKNLAHLAKRGGKLLSGVDSRAIIFDFYKESDKLEDKREVNKT